MSAEFPVRFRCQDCRAVFVSVRGAESHEFTTLHEVHELDGDHR